MKRCLAPQDIERLIAGTLSARRTAALNRHLSRCASCAAAFAEALANEAWFQELRSDLELAELRQRVGETASARTAATILTSTPAER